VPTVTRYPRGMKPSIGFIELRPAQRTLDETLRKERSQPRALLVGRELLELTGSPHTPFNVNCHFCQLPERVVGRKFTVPRTCAR
jgi:hypothetical protein